MRGGENEESQTGLLGAPSPTVSSSLPSKQHHLIVEAQTENKKNNLKDRAIYKG